MLYITTRENKDAFTSYHTLCKETGPEGGQFIPFQSVRFSKQEISDLKEKIFAQCVAEILNQFFSSRLDAWDVDCCIGRYPVKLVPMSHKIVVGETWNNPEWDFSRVVRNLRGRILGTADTNDAPSGWTWIAVRIAVLFGLFGEMFRAGSADPAGTIDVAVSAGDFSAPVAVWYAREMGLPIGTISFACNDSGLLWELMNHGEFRPRAARETYVPEACANALLGAVERLIYEVFGSREAMRFAQTVESGCDYFLDEEQVAQLRTGMFCAVVSQKRTMSVIRNVYRTNTYLLSPESALAYGGLQDYRATNNETGPALILTEQGPLTAVDAVSEAIGIAPDELKARIRTA